MFEFWVDYCSDGKESACNARDLGSIPGLGRSPGDGKGYPLQYSAVENSMDCIALGVTKSQTQWCDFTLEHLDGTGCHDLHFLNVEF